MSYSIVYFDGFNRLPQKYEALLEVGASRGLYNRREWFEFLMQRQPFLGKQHGDERLRHFDQHIRPRRFVVPPGEVPSPFGQGHAFRPFAAQFDNLAQADGEFRFGKTGVGPGFAGTGRAFMHRG